MNTSDSSKQGGDAGRKNIRIRNLIENMERTFLPAGHIIGKYKIIQEIDRGGMAVVYKATQLDLNREVALKVMPANITINRKFVERFLTEAHAVAQLSHPNIVSIHEVAREDNIYYLAMDYVKGENLYYFLHHKKPKLVDVLEIVSRLADALAYAHRMKIIHRDLKLNNVIMRDPVNPVLIDFGLAKTMETDDDSVGLTRTGEIMGSPSYMAPERLLNGVTVDHRSDICSLGIMLYEMLTFKNPYLDQRNLHQTTINVMEANPIPLRKLVPWLPEEIEAITLKAMSKDISLRYQYMEEFKADINRYQRGEIVLARPPSFFSRLSRFFRINWAPVVICSLILLFLSTIFFSIQIRNSKERSHWQLIYDDSFDSLHKNIEWSFFPGLADSNWILKDGSLRGNSANFSFARLQRRFNRDLLIECDISSDSLDLFNTGIFLFGDQPDSGYCFHLNKDGKGLHGISYPGSSLIFNNISMALTTFGKNNHIEIERFENTMTFTVNKVIVSRIHDCFPPLGKGHDRIGFFVNGSSARFDNLKIWRRAIPQLPSPALIADRFRERGDIESALDEYRGLQLDFAEKDLFKETPLKEIDCLIRLHRYEEAYEVILQKTSGYKEEDLIVRKLFLEATLFSRLGQKKEVDSLYKIIALRYPVSAENNSLMNTALIDCQTLIRKSRLDSAEYKIRSLVNQYSRFKNQWGQLHLDLARKHLFNFNLEKAQYITQEIVVTYNNNKDIITSAYLLLGKIFLERGLYNNAKQYFNQCIAGYSGNDSFWDGWYALAGIYEYEASYNDAITIYQKISAECPANSPLPFMAAIKRGELLFSDSPQESMVIFQSIADGPNLFPVPHLIASFYTNRIGVKTFISKWKKLQPENDFYKYHIARKAIFDKDTRVAKSYLMDLKNRSRPGSWQFSVISKLLNSRNWQSK